MIVDGWLLIKKSPEVSRLCYNKKKPSIATRLSG